MCTAVSMDTGCWFGPVELPSPSKFRTGCGGRGRVWISGFDAEGRVRKESDCSRCEGGCVKGYFTFPPWFSLVSCGGTGHCPRHSSCALSVQRCLFRLGPAPTFKSLFSLFKWELPSSGTLSKALRPNLWDRVILLLEEQNSELHNNAFPH